MENTERNDDALGFLSSQKPAAADGVLGPASEQPEEGKHTRLLSKTKQNIFLIFITLTQLVQMIPLGAGINSGLAIGEAVGASPTEAVWIVASYPLTQGAFVLVGTHKLTWSTKHGY
jgi:hypothetical protein